MIDEKKIRMGNRISGLAMVAFGVILTQTDSTLLDAVGSLFVIEGAVDFISRRHHYVSTGIIRYLSRDRIDIRYRGDSNYTESVHGVRSK